MKVWHTIQGWRTRGRHR